MEIEVGITEKQFITTMEGLSEYHQNIHVSKQKSVVDG